MAEVEVIAVVAAVEAVGAEATAPCGLARAETAVNPPLLATVAQTRVGGRDVDAAVGAVRDDVPVHPVPPVGLVARVKALHSKGMGKMLLTGPRREV